MTEHYEVAQILHSVGSLIGNVKGTGIYIFHFFGIYREPVSTAFIKRIGKIRVIIITGDIENQILKFLEFPVFKMIDQNKDLARIQGYGIIVNIDPD